MRAEIHYTGKFTDAVSLRKAISVYVDFYNNEKLQERFGDKAPSQIRAGALATDAPEQYPIVPNKRIETYKIRFAA